MPSVIPRRTSQQRHLQRYMAYRVQVWLQLNHPLEQNALALRTKIHKATLSSVKHGKSSSQKIAMKLSAALGPAPLEAFLSLAEQWGEAFPTWQPGDPIADPPTHLSLSTEDRWADMTQRYPVSLIRAARALQLLEEGVSESSIQDTVDMAWANSKDDAATHDYTSRQWLKELEPLLARVLRGSGERASAKKILSAVKA